MSSNIGDILNNVLNFVNNAAKQPELFTSQIHELINYDPPKYKEPDNLINITDDLSDNDMYIKQVYNELLKLDSQINHNDNLINYNNNYYDEYIKHIKKEANKSYENSNSNKLHEYDRFLKDMRSHLVEEFGFKKEDLINVEFKKLYELYENRNKSQNLETINENNIIVDKIKELENQNNIMANKIKELENQLNKSNTKN